MAGFQRITDKTERTTPAGTDVAYIVNPSGITPEATDFKVSLSTLQTYFNQETERRLTEFSLSNWTLVEDTRTGAYWYSMIYSSELKMWLALPFGANPYLYSYDGVQFTEQSAGGVNIRGGIWISEQSQFVIFGTTSSSEISTSPDGLTWTTQTTPEDITPRVLAYIPTLDRIVALGESARGYYSDDEGVSWTAFDFVTGSASTPYDKAVWDANQSRLIISARTGTAGAFDILTSPDGLTYTNRTPPTGMGVYEPSMVYDSVTKLVFSAFSDTATGTEYKLYSSGDGGVNWTYIRDLPAAPSLTLSIPGRRALFMLHQQVGSPGPDYSHSFDGFVTVKTGKLQGASSMTYPPTFGAYSPEFGIITLRGQGEDALISLASPEDV